jgi:penicillin-binding protein 1A
LQIEDGPIDNRRVMIGGLTGILGEWGTERDETRYADTITAREALLQSRNAATVRLGERVGLDAVKELAQKAGIKSPLRDYPSAFLGASEAKLDEMCLAFSVFANGGHRPRDLMMITRITDAEGKVIHQVREDDDRMVPVLDEIAAYQTHSCLADALKRGTGKPAYDEFGLEQFPAAGKTGTGYEFKDLWFIGYTSAVTGGVWCGFDQQKTIYTGAFSNRIALPIWVDVMNAAKKTYKPEEIPPPQNVQLIEVCRRSGLRATDSCYQKVPDTIHGGTRSVRDTFKEVLRRESVFDQYCDVHTSTDAPGELLKSHPQALSLDSTEVVRIVAGVVPVRMQSLAVIGEDPYNSVQPPPPKAEPVGPDGVPVPKARPVEEESPVNGSSPIKLKPPPPIKLDP